MVAELKGKGVSLTGHCLEGRGLMRISQIWGSSPHAEKGWSVCDVIFICFRGEGRRIWGGAAGLSQEKNVKERDIDIPKISCPHDGPE